MNDKQMKHFLGTWCEDLLPCPYCGHDKPNIQEKKHPEGGHIIHQAYCPACWANQEWYENVEDAIKWWNKRADIDKIRTAVADYISSEGCACCRGSDHEKHQDIIGELLGIEKFDDDSGYDFYKYKTGADMDHQ